MIRHLLIFLLLSATASQAQTAADFYRGRTITIIVGSSTGGGYDLNARLLSKYFGKHMPGQPSSIVQNMPGGGGIKAATYIFSAAPRNGTVFAILQHNISIEPLFTPQNFDGSKFTWLGSIASDTTTCISWHTSPIKSWDNLLTHPYTAAGQAAGADGDVFAMTIKNMFRAPIKLITGYPGTSDMTLAMQRGEVDGMCGMSLSTLQSRYAKWLTDGSINILVQAGLTKNPALPKTPFLAEQTTDPEAQKILHLIVATEGMAHPFMAPPDLPPDRTAALRQAFDETMQDPDFLAEAKRLDISVSPMTGQAVAALLDDLYATPKSIIAKTTQTTAEN